MLNARVSLSITSPKSIVLRSMATLMFVSSMLSACGQASSRALSEPPGSHIPSPPRSAMSSTISSKATAQTNAQADTTERWVVEGSVTVNVVEMGGVLQQLRVKLNTMSAVIGNEVVHTRSPYGRSTLVVKLPPDQISSLMGWLRSRGDVTREDISREEVSRQLLTYEVTLRNANTTLKRLEVFIKKDTLSVDEVLKVEQQLRRLRGVIEENERAQELLKSRVARATLTITLTERPKPLPRAPEAKFYVGGRPSLYMAGDHMQLGWGLSVFNPRDPAHFHLDVDLIPESNTTVIKLGSGSYSDFFGGGERHFLNPNLGFELGYVNEDQAHHFVFGATVGVELLRFKYALVNARFSGLGLIGEEGLKMRALSGIDLAIVF